MHTYTYVHFPDIVSPTFDEVANGDAQVSGGARRVSSSQGIAAVFTGQRVLEPHPDGAHVDVVMLTMPFINMDFVDQKGRALQEGNDEQGTPVGTSFDVGGGEGEERKEGSEMSSKKL